MRSIASSFIRGGLFLACLIATAVPVHAEFPDLIRRVPADANAILMIDADRVFASPIAQREDWKKRQLANAADRPLSIPPKVTKILRSAKMDLQSRESLWEFVMLEAETMPSIDDIASREKGFVDTVANTKAAWSPRGAYIVKMGQDAIGMTFPPNRQFLSRWLKEPTGKISSYLLEASQSMKSTNAQMLLAFDLDDAVVHSQTETWLSTLPLVKQAKISSSDLATRLADLRGVKFEVVLKDKPWGRLELDFKHDPALLVPVAKSLVVEVLRHFGAALDDIQKWEVSNTSTSISLHGELSEGGLMRLESLFALPSVDMTSAANAQENMPLVTQNHFRMVDKLLNDILKKNFDTQPIAQSAAWLQQYAKRIDRLPLTSVDPDMQGYSAGVAEDLRAIATALRNGGLNARIQSAAVYESFDYYGYNYTGAREVDGARRAARVSANSTAMMTGIEISDRIHSETSKIRRKMTEKYKIDF